MSPGADPENGVARLNRGRSSEGHSMTSSRKSDTSRKKCGREKAKGGRGLSREEAGKQTCVSGDSCCSLVLMGGQVSRSQASRAYR